MTTQLSETMTIADLQTISQVIAIATERGAFRANELSTVGATYDKLVRFLAAVDQQFQEQETETPDETLETQGE